MSSAEKLVDFVTENSALVEPHCFSLCLEQGKEQLCQNWPSEWLDLVQQGAHHLIEFQDQLLGILRGNKAPESWPTSLISFIGNCRRLALPRVQSSARNNQEETRKDQSKTQFGFGMSQKKSHEVRLMADLVLSQARETGANVIVDIGSGSGYLTHVLAQEFPVIAVEGDDEQIQHSKFRQQVLTSKSDNDHNDDDEEEEEEARPVIHVSTYVNAESLIRLLKGFWWCKATKSVISSPTLERPRFLLTGLHACGDLSSETMLLPLISSDCDIVAVVCVGCCYQHLSPRGFPLSDLIRRKTATDHRMKFPYRDFKCNSRDIDAENLFRPCYRLLNCACQTVVNFSDQRIVDTWRSHAYRAVLNGFLQSELGIAVEHDGEADCQALRIGNLKADDFRHGLSHYALIVRRKCNLSFTESQLEQYAETVDLASLTAVISFISTIRRLLGPCIESLVLLDRLLFLEQHHGFHADLVSLFDYSVSPRNMCLIAKIKG